ncbi:MAG: hypothetical protein HDR44_01405 [Allobaculum sp.]|nr:hypothetical protein [Allobaculum sp.]
MEKGKIGGFKSSVSENFKNPVKVFKNIYLSLFLFSLRARESQKRGLFLSLLAQKWGNGSFLFKDGGWVYDKSALLKGGR